MAAVAAMAAPPRPAVDSAPLHASTSSQLCTQPRTYLKKNTQAHMTGKKCTYLDGEKWEVSQNKELSSRYFYPLT